MKTRLAVLAATCCAATQALACFTVYDRNNNIVYNAQQPPVDMSRPLHETMPTAFPGGHLVFDTGTECPVANPERRLRTASPATRSPLLTDAATAERLGLQHTLVADGVAMVPDRPDEMRPGVVLAESGLPQPAGPDTRMMGAGPARPATQSMGAGPAPQSKSAAPPLPPLLMRGPIITEMHNPPLTAVQPAPAYRSR